MSAHHWFRLDVVAVLHPRDMRLNDIFLFRLSCKPDIAFGPARLVSVTSLSSLALVANIKAQVVGMKSGDMSRYILSH